MTTAADIRLERIDGRGDRHYLVHGDPRVAGVPLVSVTAVLSVIGKPALVGWANKEARAAVEEALTPIVGSVLTGEALNAALESAKVRPGQKRDTAAELGTRAHAAIEAVLKGEATQYDVDADVWPAVEGFLQWREQSGITVDVAERMVYHSQHRYAGTMDAIGRNRKGQLVALDWKTSNGTYAEMGMQVAAYAYALFDMGETLASDAWVIRFPKTAPTKKGEPWFEAKQVRDLHDAFQGFTSALNLYRTLKEPMWA